MKKILKISILIVFTIIILLPIAGYLGWNHEVGLHNGSHTKVIDPTPFVNKYEELEIRNVNVYDSDSAYFILRNVNLKSGVIVGINATSAPMTAGHLVDGTGKYLIPGLVDTHVHLLNSKNDLYLYLINGITSVCEMFGTVRHLKWKEEAQNGSISPSIFVSTPKVASRHGAKSQLEKYFEGAFNFTSSQKAHEGIVQFKKAGYDAIKLGSYLELEVYNAIIKESKNQNIPVVGHLSTDVGLNNLYSSGQVQLAHLEEIARNTIRDFGGLDYDNTDEFITYLKKEIDGIAIKLRENQIAVSTTLSLMEKLPERKFESENFLTTIELEYANPGIVEGSKMSKGWLPGNNDFESKETGFEQSKAYYGTYIKAIQIIAKALSDNGVKILIGTDSNIAGTVPGFSIHDEMRALAKIGIPNLEILNAATAHATDFTHGKTGKVKEGFKSDLILLSSNPIEDIENAKDIEMVFFNKYMINKEQIGQLLKAIEDTNNNSRNTSIERYLK